MLPARASWTSWVLSLTVFVGLAFTRSGAGAQQPGDSRYFSETGHTVRGEFLQFFDQRGGLEIFGFPITDEHVEPQSGLRVQYFQRARFEWRPDNPEAYRVELGLLGAQFLAEQQPPRRVGRAADAANPNCHFFPTTGHNVCYSFRDFYFSRGGLDIFGYPITETIQENGRFVQYFQRARFEWHPERPGGQRVQLAMLGVLYFDLAGLDRSLLPPSNATLRQITSVVAHASVEKPITAAGDSQTVYVYVVDQQGQPIQGAQVTVIAHLPDGDQAFQLPAADARGTTAVTFGVGQATPGAMILLDVTAVAGPLAGATRTSFLPWW
jgi:hypothetical protein